jgi:hypothetical protein
MNNLIGIMLFSFKGGIIGLLLGLAGAIFGTVIGGSFIEIWSTGMPLAMATLGAMIFALLCSIGMHRGIRKSTDYKPDTSNAKI